MNKYQLVIFDFDGTLNDTMSFWGPALQTGLQLAANKLHIDAPRLTIEQANSMIGTKFSESIPDLLGANLRDQWRVFYECILGEELKMIREGNSQLFDGAVELLRDLKKARVGLGFASNCSSRYLETNTKRFNLNYYFNTLRCLDSPGILNKTDMLIQIIGQEVKRRNLVDVNQLRVVMVGDRHHDRDSAFEAGIPFIACKYGYGKPEELEGALAYVDNINQLRGILL